MWRDVRNPSSSRETESGRGLIVPGRSLLRCARPNEPAVVSSVGGQCLPTGSPLASRYFTVTDPSLFFFGLPMTHGGLVSVLLHFGRSPT